LNETHNPVMNIEPLVFGETIKMDNHHCNHEINITDQGLHLHKRYNGNAKRQGNAEVIIPINEGEIKAIDVKGKDSAHILKEIKKAFADLEVRSRFVNSVKNALIELASAGMVDGNGNRVLNKDKQELVDSAIKRIAELFGMTEADVKEFMYFTPSQRIGAFKSKLSYEAPRSVLAKDMDGFNVKRRFPEQLFVKADAAEESFIVSTAKYMIVQDYGA